VHGTTDTVDGVEPGERDADEALGARHLGRLHCVEVVGRIQDITPLDYGPKVPWCLALEEDYDDNVAETAQARHPAMGQWRPQVRQVSAVS
jgi:hypothetical protein